MLFLKNLDSFSRAEILADSEMTKGLKIPRSKIRTGSIPVAGTKRIPTPKGAGILLVPATGIEPI